MGNMITVTRKKRNYNTHLLKQGVVRVGFFPESRYDGGKSVAEVARYNEFGVPRDSGERIPPRPFMRPAVFEHKTDLTNLLHRQDRQALRGIQVTMVVLERFGEYVKGLIQEQIINTNEPPNAPSTIKRKGFNAPLRDTHLMLNSVRYQAEERAKK
jgi:hypothetical protein